jgi:hypothetical protein
MALTIRPTDVSLATLDIDNAERTSFLHDG